MASCRTSICALVDKEAQVIFCALLSLEQSRSAQTAQAKADPLSANEQIELRIRMELFSPRGEPSQPKLDRLGPLLPSLWDCIEPAHPMLDA